MNISVSMINPGGNITLLVEGMFDKSTKKTINDFLLKQFPKAEQVGFFGQSNTIPQLEMAGGEFCGNAVRSLSHLLLNEKTISLDIEIVGKTIRTGYKDNLIFTEIPIKPSFSSITKISSDLYKVELEGITHLISLREQNDSIDNLKKIAKDLLEQFNLLTSSPAAGVMFVKKSQADTEVIAIDPVVWVRDIQTLFYETACGSGTTAIALWISKNRSENITTLHIQQPSNAIFTAVVEKSQKEFINAQIAGPVQTLFKNKILSIDI